MSSAPTNKRKGQKGQAQLEDSGQPEKKRKSWTVDEEYAVAVYIQENYEKYKVSCF